MHWKARLASLLRPASPGGATHRPPTPVVRRRYRRHPRPPPSRPPPITPGSPPGSPGSPDTPVQASWRVLRAIRDSSQEPDTPDPPGERDGPDDGIARRAYEECLDDALVCTLPHSCFCPITHVPMCDPVVAADGHSYEREAISRWFMKQKTSPVAHVSLSHTALMPNHALRNVITELVHGWQSSPPIG